MGHMACAGFEMVPGVPDGKGKPRTAIVFRLVPLADEGPSSPPPPDQSQPPSWYWSVDLNTLRDVASRGAESTSDGREARRKVHHRSEAVKIYVQRRAEGKCEGCGLPAPFLTAKARPYLEPHHTRRLSDGGPDHPAWVVAICPTCHRRAHHASDAESYNRFLLSRANELEGLSNRPQRGKPRGNQGRSGSQ